MTQEPVNIDTNQVYEAPITSFTLNGIPMHLSPMEGKLFAILYHNPGQWMSWQQLAKKVWPRRKNLPYPMFTNLMSRLHGRAPGLIQNAGWGKGYCYPGPATTKLPDGSLLEVVPNHEQYVPNKIRVPLT